ncbi:MAG: hypothetical protein CME70_19160 [Halobacteriovorax sp.]|nr:hypothetical protein [Halobacteriovorax sp.]|tara:strand:- start:822 stop:1142 length:321 start_codon:yes stop_codon:yes gene_type:complete
MGLIDVLAQLIPGLGTRERERSKLAKENLALSEKLLHAEQKNAAMLQKLFHGRQTLEQEINDMYRMYDEGVLDRMQDPVKGLVCLYTHMVCSHLGFENPIPIEFDA